MRVCVVGNGYVGLVTAAGLAELDHEVVGVDVDEHKVARLSAGECVIQEPELPDLLAKHVRSGRLRFTTHVDVAARDADVVFIGVGTPPHADGSCDLRSVLDAARALAPHLADGAVVAIKSTVPAGTGDRVAAVIASASARSFHVASNPEFLREGSAVADFRSPDRIVIGADDPGAAQRLIELYQPLALRPEQVIVMPRAAAELTKYAANAFLAMRISFINEIAAICDKLRLNVDHVRRGIATDHRIGDHFLQPGAGYGGSCFPKDVRALRQLAADVGVAAGLVRATDDRNEQQRGWITRQIFRRLGRDLTGVRIAIWGVAFKPHTDDIREAPAVVAIEQLLNAGADLAVHDPKALDNLQERFGARLRYAADAAAALHGAGALAILTEWPEYRDADLAMLRQQLVRPLVFDARNIYSAEALRAAGIEYYSVGRPAVAATELVDPSARTNRPHAAETQVAHFAAAPAPATRTFGTA